MRNPRKNRKLTLDQIANKKQQIQSFFFSATTSGFPVKNVRMAMFPLVGWAKYEVAGEIGMSRQHFQSYMDGNVTRADGQEKIASFFGIPRELFFAKEL